jgi:hypothetical protein
MNDSNESDMSRAKHLLHYVDGEAEHLDEVDLTDERWDDGSGKQFMPLMAKRIGAELGGVAPEARRELERSCSLCDVQGRCAGWLAGDRDDGAYRSFCVNAETLDGLRPCAKQG